MGLDIGAHNLLGDKGGDTNQSADALSALSQQLFQETDPLRTSLIGRSADFLNGGDVTNSPQFGSLKNAVDSQFTRARDNTIARTAPGGALTDALTGLEGTRASTMAQGIGGLQENELSRALGLATGSAPTALGGLGNAANAQAQAIAAQQAQQGAMKQGAGQGLGTLFATKA